jgi:SAM-dependent methyltransferase
VSGPSRPGDRWRGLLRQAAVPEAIAASAPEPGPTLEPERFRWRPDEDARQPVRPSRRRALEALPAGGSVLDVGVGGGASSLGLVPRAGLIVGVDPIAGMLESFRASAEAAGVRARAVLGRWPDVAGEVEPADVVVCHHAIYRVEEIEDFVLALTNRARRRVVVELSAHGPHAGLDELWKSFHGMERHQWEVADELQAVLAALGLSVERDDLDLPPSSQEVTPALVELVRRRLYVGADRDPEIEAFLRSRPVQPHRVVALWWPGGADA